MSITKSVGRLTLWALVLYLFLFGQGALVFVPRKLVVALAALVAALVHACSGSASSNAHQQHDSGETSVAAARTPDLGSTHSRTERRLMHQGR